ncbi:hypothetical protein BKA61DRAFT_699040 [Leptodontidium sp. MPI-SDFR-AT-0119]|nr:hypothetical protein BKA61DRAFT_699040 [Leptodontidium sp. MPI-SDFR-AT-0119]
MASRRNSEVNLPSSINTPRRLSKARVRILPRIPIPVNTPTGIDLSKVTTPIQPATPFRPRPLATSSATAGHAPPNGLRRSQIGYGIIGDLPFLVKDLIFFLIGHLTEAILGYWTIFGPTIFLLALFYSPALKELPFGAFSSLAFGWIPRTASYFTSFSSGTLQWILGGLDNVLARFEEAARTTPYGSAPNLSKPSVPYTSSNPLTSSNTFTPRVSYILPAHSTPGSFSLWNNVSWVAGPVATVYDGLKNILPTSVVNMESVFGKFISNSLFLAAGASACWFAIGFKYTILSGILFFAPLQIITAQLIDYLVQSGICGSDLSEKRNYIMAIGFLLLFRAFKFFVHIRSSTPPADRPISRPYNNTYKPGDVTVIIPTKGSYVPDDMAALCSREGHANSSSFLRSLSTILENEPAEVILATTGLEAHKNMNLIAARFGTHRVKVTSIMDPVRNLRRQFLKATDSVKTDIICYAHAEVRWEESFLKNALAPFNDPDVGLVGVPVEMRRLRNPKSQHLTFNPKQFRARILRPPQPCHPRHPAARWLEMFPFKVMKLIDYTFTDKGRCYSALNYLECLYYQRINHESASTNRIDGGIALVSAKSALIRTRIVQSTDFRLHFPHEKILGLLPVFGSMRSDAAHFITRKVHGMGFKVRFQDTPSTTVKYNFKYPGLDAYCQKVSDRYSSLYRSNLASLRADIYSNHMWTAYTMLLSLANVPLIVDGGLTYLFWFFGHYQCLLHFVGATFGYRVYEQYPHLSRYPRDWKLVPLGIGFYYLESLFQVVGLLYACFPEVEPE